MQDENTQAFDWLKRRGITDTVITAFNISIADVPALGLQKAIVIPVNHVDGEHAFNKYRRSPLEGDVKPKYLFERGGKVTLYGADKLVTHQQITHLPDRAKCQMVPVKPKVVITEGELDTLVCWSNNIPAVSSTAGASSFQEEWATLLSRYDVYICFDNDEAGHKGAVKVLSYLPNARVMFVPNNISGVKDISDYVARGGSLHALMQTARHYNLEDVEAEREQIAARWGDYTFHDIYIDHFKTKALPSNVGGSAAPTSNSDDRKERAKSVDCTTLIEFHRHGGGGSHSLGRYPVAKCYWHNDKTPSLTYYKRTNSCYCHACGKYADSIDIVMARDGLSGKEGFKEAVKILLKE